MSGADVTELGK